MICKVKKCIKEQRKTEERNINEGDLKITTVQSGIRIISSNTDFSDVIDKSLQTCAVTSASEKLL